MAHSPTHTQTDTAALHTNELVASFKPQLQTSFLSTCQPRAYKRHQSSYKNVHRVAFGKGPRQKFLIRPENACFSF